MSHVLSVVSQLLFCCPPLLTKNLELETFSKFLSPTPLCFLCSTMSAKTTRSKSQSRAGQRLQAHNQSLGEEHRSRSHSSRRSRSWSPVAVVERVRDRSATGLSQSSNDPPEWAKELLLQQKEYGKELKRLKAELATKPNKAGKHEDTEPEFKFEGNKKQYQLNKKVLEKIKAAKDVGDDDLRKEFLEGGEQLLIECNKHICIAAKYGWDTVECYTTDPITSDSDDEKIKKAVKECKLLREEKRKAKLLKSKRPMPMQRGVARRVILEKPPSTSMAGKVLTVSVTRELSYLFSLFSPRTPCP